MEARGAGTAKAGWAHGAAAYIAVNPAIGHGTGQVGDGARLGNVPDVGQRGHRFIIGRRPASIGGSRTSGKDAGRARPNRREEWVTPIGSERHGFLDKTAPRERVVARKGPPGAASGSGTVRNRELGTGTGKGSPQPPQVRIEQSEPRRRCAGRASHENEELKGDATRMPREGSETRAPKQPGQAKRSRIVSNADRFVGHVRRSAVLYRDAGGFGVRLVQHGINRPKLGTAGVDPRVRSVEEPREDEGVHEVKAGAGGRGSEGAEQVRRHGGQGGSSGRGPAAGFESKGAARRHG
jgi:hypothetical protein